jgi:serine/threonine protein kinase
MAPEQFHGKAVFASDIYSLGVTMYQMLTGVLPYDPPTAADLDRLATGELITPPRFKNAKIPGAINDIVMKALSPDIPGRYQRAGEVLDAVLAERPRTARRAAASGPASETMQEIRSRIQARGTPQARFCWQCRKPLHARSDRCPFCGEAQ